jgi:integrase/recombinase XerD
MGEKILKLNNAGEVFKQIEMFLKKKSFRSENTAISYKKDIQRFFRIVREKELQFLTIEDVQLNLDDMDEYISYLVDQKELSNKTINHSVVSVRELLRYLKQKKIVEDVDYLNFIDRLPEVNSNSYGILTVDEVLKMAELAKTERNLKMVKHYLILFALDTGLRRNSILNVTFGDFEVIGETVTVKAIDKGGKFFKKSISKDFYEQLLTLRKDENDNNEKLFKISLDAVDSMLPRLVEKMNINKDRNITFHSIRKCAVSFSYKVTGDILAASKVAGHSSISTTQIYLETQEYGAIGAVSSSQNLNENLFNEVSHDELLEAISSLNKDYQLLLNLKLQDMKKSIK